MTRRNNDAAFAAALSEHLGRHGLKQIDLVRAHGVSSAYVSRMANAAGASPGTVNLIANTTSASAVERYQLNVAAAQGKGYDIADYVKQLEAENADLKRQLMEKK